MARGMTAPPRESAFVLDLLAARGRYGAAGRRQRLNLMTRAGRESLHRAADFTAYHEWLLFHAAYPDDAAVLRAVTRELRRIAAIARSAPGLRGKLRNSGIAHSDACYSFSWDITAWLSARFGRAVEIEWDDGSAGDALDELLPRLVSRCERDGLLCDRFTTREWLTLARGRARTDLAWLLRRIARATVGGRNDAARDDDTRDESAGGHSGRDDPAHSEHLRDELFDRLELSVVWRLSDAIASRTFCRFPPRRLAPVGDALIRQADVAGIVVAPLPTTPYLARRLAQQLIDIGRAVLAARGRETDPIAYADPRDVRLARLEHGIDVAIYGMRPPRRLPLESFFGFVAAKNRVPVGYGGGWVFGGRCEIGVNIFDTFRGGESALIFAQVMRVYAQLFGAWRFIVDPFQFGQGNAEAIRSGAFWFYHRLGFCPLDARLRTLADDERALLKADPRRRTPAPTLRKLATAKLVLDVGDTAPRDGGTQRAGDPGDVTEIGLAVSRFIARKFGGDRDAAEIQCARWAARLLSLGAITRLQPAERRAFAEFSVLASLIPDLSRWSRADRTALATLMRSKGAVRESRYARHVRQHAKFIEALSGISAAGTRQEK